LLICLSGISTIYDANLIDFVCGLSDLYDCKAHGISSTRICEKDRCPKILCEKYKSAHAAIIS
jgi:hypothetical protein